MCLMASAEYRDVQYGTGNDNFFLNPFRLSNLSEKLECCPCQGYLQVKVHPAVIEDIGDLYSMLIKVV